jgi:hypothetical protein
MGRALIVSAERKRSGSASVVCQTPLPTSVSLRLQSKKRFLSYALCCISHHLPDPQHAHPQRRPLRGDLHQPLHRPLAPRIPRPACARGRLLEDLRTFRVGQALARRDGRRKVEVRRVSAWGAQAEVHQVERAADVRVEGGDRH